MKIMIKMIFPLYVILSVGCTTMESRDWGLAEHKNTIESYENFVSLHPKSQNISKAQNKITQLTKVKEDKAKLKEDKAYFKAIQKKSISTLKKFLKNYPETKKRDEINKLITSIRIKNEDELYAEAMKSGSYSILKYYTDEYPQGRYRKQVKHKQDLFIWSTIKTPLLIPWKKMGIPEPLNTDQLTDLTSAPDWARFKVEILANLKSGSLTKFRTSLIFSLDDAKYKGKIKIHASQLYISMPYETYDMVKLTIKKGSILPTINAEPILAVGSTLEVSNKKSPIKLSDYFIRSGIIKAVPEGLELQVGGELLKDK